MKKTILIISTLALFACNSKVKHVSKPSDTTKMLAIYRFDTAALRADTVFRVTKDSLKLSKVDSASGKASLQWYRDTTFYVAVLIDTPNKKIRWFGLPGDYVQEVKIKPIR